MDWTLEDHTAYANLNWLITVIDEQHPDYRVLHEWFNKLSSDGAAPPTRKLAAQIDYRCNMMREAIRANRQE